MSTPSTPARQHGPPSSTSTPSTTSHGSPSSQLTPRSKVRALVAAIDDDSDAEVEAGTNASAERVGLGGALNGNSDSERIGGGDDETDSDDGEEDADDEEVLPRGRLAARMQGKKSGRMGGEWETSAYMDLKRRLMRGARVLWEEYTEANRKSAEASSEEDGRITDATAQVREKRTLEKRRSQGTPTSPALQPPTSSSGLFVSSSPEPPREVKDGVIIGSNASDSDLPARPTENSRFLALVARKREERLAKEEAESRKKAEREAQLKALSKQTHRARESSPIVGSEDDSDGNEGGRKLTQQARPTRKASKKALEEMNRETQRMSRNMQLAHQARTKKKITKESFFAKFNSQPLVAVPADASKAAGSSTAASSVAMSDAEGLQLRETPPTSPVGDDEVVAKMGAGDGVFVIPSTERSADRTMDLDEELPTMEKVMTQPVQRLDKGKGKAREPSPMEKSPTPGMNKKMNFNRRPIRVHPPQQPARLGSRMLDSDSDLEIVAQPTTKPTKTDIFDRLPEEKPTDARSLLTLRALANLTPTGNANSKTKASMTPTDMQNGLRKRARQQAAQERAEKLQQLRDKGIIVQTAEEREKDQAAVEDLVEKARREAEGIFKKEKDAAKKEGKESGKIDGLDDTSDEDEEEYVDDVEEELVELSGSEEDGGNDDDDGEADGDDDKGMLAANATSENVHPLIDREASEEGQEDEQGDDEASEDDEDQPLTIHNRRKSKNAHVISDDDDDDDDAIPARQSSEAAIPAQNPFIPGLPISAGMPLGLTQAFAATMADSQTQADDVVMADSLDPEQDSLAFLRGMPEPNFPVFDTMLAQDAGDMVRDSQLSHTQSRVEESQEAVMRPDIDLHYSQSQVRYDSLLDTQHMPTATQFSELPDPTQDVGFAAFSPPAGRSHGVPSSTVDTLLLSSMEDTPIIKKKGRLRRRAEAVSVLADVEQDFITPEVGGDSVISPNVFDVMRKAAKKPAQAVEEFDRKKSEAKGMVEEQAEESEDEYAGLGGASDDESAGSEDEEMQKMIDESDIKVDERKLAAFYADKERASDAKAVEKLFKDMNSGLLRRKRGADFDLSDDSDDGEARRRRKQRDFARMRKALLADENIGKIAENPKKLAFLRAIEDREKDNDDEDDLDFLDRAPDDDDDAAQHSQPAGDNDEDAQSQTPAPQRTRHRPLADSVPDAANRRPPPPPLRRARTRTTKPASLAEIRHSVSFLLEEPHADAHAHLGLGLESSDAEDHNDDDDHPVHPQNRTHRPALPVATTRRPIIDRIALKRASSAAAAAATTKLAFHDPATAATLPAAFRVPSLLRRATTQNVDAGADAKHGVTARMERATGSGEGAGSGGMKMGGSKRSSIGYFAREAGRRVGLGGREGGRERERLRVLVRERRGVGVGGGGSFK